MNHQNTAVIGEKEVVIVPLKRWREIEESLENLEMYHSRNLAKEIARRRVQKKVTALDDILKKYGV